MKRFCFGALTVLALLPALPAAAQVSITGAIAGTVMDSSNSVIPGATVLLKDEGTGIQKTATSNTSGEFIFRDLHFGSYQVTVSLQGFQSAVFNKVIVDSGRTTDLRVTLSVGRLDESVVVEGTTPVLEMTSNVISSTVTNKDVNELPLPSRSALAFARLVPGAVAPSGTGSTHYNGMPGGVINPTIDGVNNSSNGFKSGGTSFFTTVPSRLGAVEQVTVESAGLGGDDGVTGGVNLKFVTRRGTNRYSGSFFDQYRTDKLNANTFGNEARGLPKPRLRRHDFGGNFGGPIFPKGALANKLFGFVNYEVEWIPQTQTRSQTLLTTEAQQGIFRYATAAGEQRTVDVLQMAAAAGLQSTPDPLIATLLATQQEARAFGVVDSAGNLRTQTLSWSEPQKAIDTFPTVRVDYQATSNLSFMGSYNSRRQDQQGRRVWPLPGYPIQLDTFDANWWVVATGTNWSISPNMLNELRFGVQHSGDTNERGREAEHFNLNGVVNGLPARLSMPFVSPLAADQAPVIGQHYITTITDTLTFMKGDHSITVGGNYRDTQWRDRLFSGTGTAGYLGLPLYTIGVATGDPVSNVFSTSTIPGLVSDDQAAVRNLYALLTGRLSQVQTGRVVDPATLEYSSSVFRENWTSAWFGGLFVQDRWRMSPNFTLNLGLRYEFNQPPFNHTGTTAFPDDANLYGPSTQLFAPGQLDGIIEPVLRRGTKAAGADWTNLAPRIGFAWIPNFGDNLLGTIFGRGQETVIRGGWDITFYDEGTNMFAATAGSNPGQSQSMLLQPGMPGFTVGSLTLQSPLPPFRESPARYQEEWLQSELTFGTTGLQTMFSDLETPYVQAWNIGVQRLISKNTVFEVRYVGNRSEKNWHRFNLNEVNTIDNSFIQEFRNAQQNLAINEANGLTGFANNGLAGQFGLPVLEAAFGARGSQAALPANQAFTNAGFITNLRQGEAGRMATSLSNNQTYFCRMVGNTFSPCASRNYNAPGPYPMNHFLLNPYAIGGSLNVIDDDGYTRYNSLQMQVRRRLTNGITATVNYTLAENKGTIWADSDVNGGNYFTLRDTKQNYGPTPFDVRHVLQGFGTYDLPFGRGRHWNIENGVLDAIAGGWTLGAIAAVQSGTPFRLVSGRQTVNGEDSGVILMNGHTVEEIQNMINIRPGPDTPSRYWVDAALVGPDGRANAEYLGVPTTPGEWGQRIVLRGKNTWQFDLSLNKSTVIYGRTRLLVHITMQNVLNQPQWGPPGFLSNVNITSDTFGVVTNPINNNTPRLLYSRFTVAF